MLLIISDSLHQLRQHPSHWEEDTPHFSIPVRIKLPCIGIVYLDILFLQVNNYHCIVIFKVADCNNLQLKKNMQSQFHIISTNYQFVPKWLEQRVRFNRIRNYLIFTDFVGIYLFFLKNKETITFSHSTHGLMVSPQFGSSAFANVNNFSINFEGISSSTFVLYFSMSY